MTHHYSIFVITALAVVELTLSPAPSAAQEFETKAQAQQFMAELTLVHQGRRSVLKPMQDFMRFLGREYSTYVKAVNGSETVEETDAKYQVPLLEFDNTEALIAEIKGLGSGAQAVGNA